jgi:hypothetical protein
MDFALYVSRVMLKVNYYRFNIWLILNYVFGNIKLTFPL